MKHRRRRNLILQGQTKTLKGHLLTYVLAIYTVRGDEHSEHGASHFSSSASSPPPLRHGLPNAPPPHYAVRTVLRLERDAWSMANKASNEKECTPPIPFRSCLWSVKTRYALAWHCREMRGYTLKYGRTTTTTHERSTSPTFLSTTHLHTTPSRDVLGCTLQRSAADHVIDESLHIKVLPGVMLEERNSILGCSQF